MILPDHVSSVYVLSAGYLEELDGSVSGVTEVLVEGAVLAELHHDPPPSWGSGGFTVASHVPCEVSGIRGGIMGYVVLDC